MEKYILSLDSGTTSNRAILFNHSGDIVATANQEFEQHYPQPGWVEHDANLIWKTQLAVIKTLMSKQNVKAQEIAAIGITNQRETTVIWHRETGEPIAPAIVWQDRRTADMCQLLKEKGFESMITAKTGLLADAYFSGTKIAWLLDNIPNARALADAGKLAFGTIDTWLVWKLTGGKMHITDPTNASRTMLYNIHTLEWDEALLDLLQIPKSLLPTVYESSQVYGYCNPDLLGGEIPIAGIAGDQQAALFGQMCIKEGMVKNTYGTGCFVVMNTGKTPIQSKNKLLSTIAWQINGEVTYALEGSIFMGGAVVQWLRDELGIIQSSSDIESLALKVENNGGVYFVQGFVGLGAPHWDQYATGAIIGLSRGTNRSHIARAALEAIAYRSMEVIHTMSEDASIPFTELRVDGGASVNNLLMQIQADTIQGRVVRPRITETTALGAAYLAGLATGYWSSIDEIQKQWQVEAVFEPVIAASEMIKRISLWQKAVERSKNWYSNH